jgi:hypothetical protein
MDYNGVAIVRVLEQSPRHKLLEGINAKGEVVFRAFECQIDPDNPSYLAALYEQDYEADYERELFLKRHDPNKIDGRKVRLEFHDNFVNLGMRANKVPSKCWRL